MSSDNQQEIARLFRDALWSQKIVQTIPVGDLDIKLLSREAKKIWDRMLNGDRKYGSQATARGISGVMRERFARRVKSEDIWGRPGRPSYLSGQVDDAISRLTSYAGWNGNRRAKSLFVEEIRKLFSGPARRSWNPPTLPPVSDLPVEIARDGQSYHYQQGQRELSIFTPQVEKSLRRFYPAADDRDVGVLVLLLYVQRSTSGSNWSPIESYPGLVQIYDSGETGILECFCGPLNHQDIVQGRECTHARLALDYQLLREHTHQEKWVGTWPVGLIPAVERLTERFTDILLLVNPPYSETEIKRVAEVLHDVHTRYARGEIKIRARMTLPDWPDIYADGETPDTEPGHLAPIVPMIRDMIIHRAEDTPSTVTNYSSASESWPTRLNYRSFTVDLTPDV